MERITLETNNTTYQIGITDRGFLIHLYYGPKAQGDQSFLLTVYPRAFSGAPYDLGEDGYISMDLWPQEYPCYGNGDFRSASFQVKNEQGVYGTDLRYRSHRIIPGKYTIPGLPAVYAGEEESYTLEIILEDTLSGLEVTLLYGVLPELDVITRSVTVKNTGTGLLYLSKVYSAALDFVSGQFDLLHFHGRHAMERNLERIPLVHGNQSFESRRGTSSHQQNPFFILAEKETSEDWGGCYGMFFLYSGNFRFEAEMDSYHQTRIQMGILDEMFEYPLQPGEIFRAPEAAMAYTEHGLTALSQICHRLIRHHVCRGPWKTARRPVLINNWEATYFDFDGNKILNIAKQAAELGVEMLVLDDGWFGSRNGDQSGLGDWSVNEEKLGGPLSDVVDQIHGLGMKFGLWIEPEMVNEDSRLYREHPDWAYTIPGRKPVRSRNQLVLDFSRKEVVDGIFAQITKVIDAADVEYIKMDMNRSICDVYTAVKGYQNYGKIMHEHVLGVYDFLERLNRRYPNLLIEGCSGGGGRFDAGMLYYVPQFWCSDNTDAIERIKIQHGTSFGYPISAVGSHVSAVPNHQTGRVTPLHTRSVVAMAGSFGYELDLNLLSEEEKEEVRRQIQDYKEYWDLIHNGDYYRLTDPGRDTEMASWAFVSRNKTEALVNVVSLNTQGNAPVSYIRCRGLAPEKQYRLAEKQPGGQQVESWQMARIYSGSTLIHVGFPMVVVPGEYRAWQYHFVEV